MKISTNNKRLLNSKSQRRMGNH